MCNYVKFETWRNILPVLKIITRTVHAVYIEISHFVNVANCACDQCSIFSTVQKFCPNYGLLLELQTLTKVAGSNACLLLAIDCLGNQLCQN